MSSQLLESPKAATTPVAQVKAPSWANLFAVAIVLVFSSHAVPYWSQAYFGYYTTGSFRQVVRSVSPAVFYDSISLIFSLLLAISVPHADFPLKGRSVSTDREQLTVENVNSCKADFKFSLNFVQAGNAAEAPLIPYDPIWNNQNGGSNR